MKNLFYILIVIGILWYFDVIPVALGCLGLVDEPTTSVSQPTTMPTTTTAPTVSKPTPEATTKPPETVEITTPPKPTTPTTTPATKQPTVEQPTSELNPEEIAALEAEKRSDVTDFKPEDTTSFIQRRYEWEWNNSSWWFDFYIPHEFYNYFRELDRTPTVDYSVYVTHPLDDEYIQLLVNEFKRIAEEKNLDARGTVDLIVAFVQSLPYTVDSVTTSYDEYPRYPVETLVDEGGDCEDTSILLASFLDTLGYDVVLIEVPNHLAVGVKGADTLPGYSYDENGVKYYYIETTGTGWQIGDMPDEYKDESAYLYHLVPTAILTHSWTVIDAEYDPLFDTAILELEVRVENIGTGSSEPITVLAGFDAGNDQVYNAERSYIDLDAGYYNTITFRLRIPRNVHTRIIVQIAENGILIDESYSKWIDLS